MTMTPIRLHLKKDEKLEIEWPGGRVGVYSIGYLRSMCPCAQCKMVRAGEGKKPTSLKILPGNFSAPVTALSAELVGNYALKIDWSDKHASGIYSFEYLFEICTR